MTAIMDVNDSRKGWAHGPTTTSVPVTTAAVSSVTVTFSVMVRVLAAADVGQAHNVSPNGLGGGRCTSGITVEIIPVAVGEATLVAANAEILETRGMLTTPSVTDDQAIPSAL